MQLRRYVATVAAVLAIGLLALTAWRPAERAPSLPYVLLDGSPRQLDALRGRVVLVNFWATTCATCVKEMPALVATHEKYHPRGYETLAIAMAYDPPAFVVNFAQTRALPFQVAIDHDGALARGFGDVQLTPTSVLLDKRGQVVRRYVGEPDLADLHAQVERLLAEG